MLKIQELQELLSELPILANTGQIDQFRRATLLSLTEAKWWVYTGKIRPEEPPKLTFISPSDITPITEETVAFLTQIATSHFLPNVDRQVALFSLSRLPIGKITDRGTGNILTFAPQPPIKLASQREGTVRVLIFPQGNGTDIPLAIEDIVTPTDEASLSRLAATIIGTSGPETRCFLYDHLGNCVFASRPYALPPMKIPKPEENILPVYAKHAIPREERGMPEHENRAAAFWRNLCELVAPKRETS